MKKKLIDKIWDLNKVYLHSLPRYNRKEIHHIINRVGISKCCLRLLCPAERGHQDDWQWVKKMRDENWLEYKQAVKNYCRNMGCYREIFALCDKCAMPKIS